MSARAWGLLRVIVFGLAIGLGVAMCLEETACTPAQARAVEPLVRASCILLRAVTNDGAALEVCATAEELAPLVPEIIAEREDAPPSPPAMLAFSLEAPRKRISRRRCVAWQERKDDAGSGRAVVAGSERGGGALDGGIHEGGGRGGTRLDGREPGDDGGQVSDAGPDEPRTEDRAKPH